jgi:ABC-type nitrate/sulfonate/bicarbonate transport system permease component
VRLRTIPISARGKLRLSHLAFFVVLVGALEAIVKSGAISQLVVSAPSEIADRLWSDLAGAELWISFAETAGEVAVSLLLSMLVGCSLGGLFYRFGLFRQAMEPLLIAFYSAPAMLLYPVLMAVLGQGSALIISMAVILGSVPIAVNVSVGFSSIDRILIKVGRSLRASPSQMLNLILIPAATPVIVTGFRVGLTFALIAVISLEFLTYSGGLGRLISWRYYTFDTTGVYSAIVLVTAIAITINSLLNALERRVRRRWA